MSKYNAAFIFTMDGSAKWPIFAVYVWNSELIKPSRPKISASARGVDVDLFKSNEINWMTTGFRRKLIRITHNLNGDF